MKVLTLAKPASSCEFNLVHPKSWSQEDYKAGFFISFDGVPVLKKSAFLFYSGRNLGLSISMIIIILLLIYQILLFHSVTDAVPQFLD